MQNASLVCGPVIKTSSLKSIVLAADQLLSHVLQFTMKATQNLLQNFQFVKARFQFFTLCQQLVQVGINFSLF